MIHFCSCLFSTKYLFIYLHFHVARASRDTDKGPGLPNGGRGQTAQRILMIIRAFAENGICAAVCAFYCSLGTLDVSAGIPAKIAAGDSVLLRAYVCARVAALNERKRARFKGNRFAKQCANTIILNNRLRSQKGNAIISGSNGVG